MEVIGHLHVSPQVPTEQEAGWASEPIWMKEENLAQPGLERGMSRPLTSEPFVVIEPGSGASRKEVSDQTSIMFAVSVCRWAC